jgi:hypothetical protein
MTSHVPILSHRFMRAIDGMTSIAPTQEDGCDQKSAISFVVSSKDSADISSADNFNELTS